MDWQTSADTTPSDFVSEAQLRSLLGRPPASGAWRESDPPAARRFAGIGPFTFECGERLPFVRIAYETWGELNPSKDNAVLVLHPLTGDAHIAGPPAPGQPTGGWWDGIVGPGCAIDTDRWFVVVPNLLGGCQGSTGPASTAPDGDPWGARFPFTTIRDQVIAQAAFADEIGIDRWSAVIGGSMGGMHALEWAAMHPGRVARLAILAAPPWLTADQISRTSLQIDAVRADSAFRDGEYYDAADGDGPHRGLSLARRMALVDYRSATELNDRFGRTWQSGRSPSGGGGRFAVESYLDFHANRFTRRFDANSYLVLVEAMNSHDVGRDRGGATAVLASLHMPALVLGITSDRLFPLEGQRILADLLPGNLHGRDPVVIESAFGHDSFLIDVEPIGNALRSLIEL